MNVPLEYSRSGRRWSVTLSDAGRTRCLVFNGSSFTKFVHAAKDLAVEDIERVVPLAAEAARVGVAEAGRLVVFLHLYLLVSIHDRSVWRGSRRSEYSPVLGLLQAVVSEIPATDPPETNWLLRYRKGEDAAARWDGLEHRVTRSRAETGHEEAQVLAAWLASRELLDLALEERDGPRLLRSLAHYKHWISGPQSDLVTKGPLRKVVEADILRISRDFPEFLNAERREREFLENWFLARFSLRDPLRLESDRKGRRIGILIDVLIFGAVALVVAEVVSAQWERSLLKALPIWTGPLVFVIALISFALLPGWFRLFYPRLFAGAVLGWSSLLGTIAGQVLLQSQPQAVHLSPPQPGLLFSIPTVLLLVLWFFLYLEVFSTIGSRKEATIRAMRMLGWAFVLVGVVGLVAHAALEKLLSIDGSTDMRLRMAVFAGGCAISLYVAVVAQLVWGDRGVSATLGGSGSETPVESR